MATMRDLAQARERVGELLDSIGIAAYLFEVEAEGDGWRVVVECALDDVRWERVTLEASHAELNAVPPPNSVASTWGRRLRACRRR